MGRDATATSDTCEVIRPQGVVREIGVVGLAASGSGREGGRGGGGPRERLWPCTMGEKRLAAWSDADPAPRRGQDRQARRGPSWPRCACATRSIRLHEERNDRDAKRRAEALHRPEAHDPWHLPLPAHTRTSMLVRKVAAIVANAFAALRRTGVYRALCASEQTRFGVADILRLYAVVGGFLGSRRRSMLSPANR